MNSELWLFDVDSYKWQKVDYKDFEPQPNPRSGCQLMAYGDQVFLYGGYARTDTAGAGTVFDDLWALSAVFLIFFLCVLCDNAYILTYQYR